MTALKEQLLIERRDSELWLTISRPDKANALTVDLMERMSSAISEATSIENVRSVVITGAGERVFCAGVDVREKPEDGNRQRHRERRSFALAALQDAVMDTPIPIVAALNGIASGGGAMIALLADSCVAADTAALTLSEIDIGIATYSGTSILEVIGGRALALDMIQTGRRMTSPEAMTRGLIKMSVSQSELKSSASAVANLVGSKDPKAFADNKRWLNRGLKAALTEARAEHARHRARN
jgi:enoyl-CoA hydratase/carnithine racemase